MTIIYNINYKKQLFDWNFVKNNKNKCFLLVNKKVKVIVSNNSHLKNIPFMLVILKLLYGFVNKK